MDLFSLLKQKGTIIKVLTKIDQFHSYCEEVLNQFRQYDFYYCRNLNLSENEILKFGRAKKHNLGDDYLTSEYEEFFYHYNHSYLTVDLKSEDFYLENLYVTADGRYADLSVLDASYEMIDEYCINNLSDGLMSNIRLTNLFPLTARKLKCISEDIYEKYISCLDSNTLDEFVTNLSQERLLNLLANKSTKLILKRI